MLTSGREFEWKKKGYIVERQLLSPALVGRVRDEIISRIRAAWPHSPEPSSHFVDGELYIIPETAPSPSAKEPEDRVSRVFNCHTEGLSKDLAQDPKIARIVRDLIGPKISCFQSQFVFKNPGVIGQPWHQDSYYFKFDRQPQVTVWIPLSEVTQENGCLWVVPGSHSGPIYDHIPDRRQEANSGYLEIAGADFSSQVPVLLSPGDVLFFHSYLMHKAADNVADYRRIAVVYHYALTGTKAISPEVEATLARVNRWMPISDAASS